MIAFERVADGLVEEETRVPRSEDDGHLAGDAAWRDVVGRTQPRREIHEAARYRGHAGIACAYVISSSSPPCY